MLRALKDLLAGLAPEPGRAPTPLPLACAVLLVEVMRAEPDVGDAERRTVLQALQRRFGLADGQLDALVQAADEASRDATDFHQFTSQINAELSQPDKVAIVETLWQVAYADGSLGDHEQHLVSRIAGLLHVTHGDLIAAKLHAKAAAGL